MDKLRRSFRSSFRRKEGSGGSGGREEPGGGGTRQWPQDEASVKANTCTFEVKYLGNVEVRVIVFGIFIDCFMTKVFESRGMQVCEEAVKLLKNSKRKPIKVIYFDLFGSSKKIRCTPLSPSVTIFPLSFKQQAVIEPSCHPQGTLHISGDGLRVADSETKGLVLDQTIEKVSFCAPDRNFERGFSYICRDGTTRRFAQHQDEFK